MHVFLYVIAIALMGAGLVGAIVPALPAIPLIFAGIWLIAGVDHYQPFFIASPCVPLRRDLAH
jgi:uncharacterized protein YqgC (DUF456 family)